MSCPYECHDEVHRYCDVNSPGDLCVSIDTYHVFQDPARIDKEGRKRLVEEWRRIEQERIERIHRELLEQYVDTLFP